MRNSNEHEEENGKLQNVTIALPKIFVENLEKLKRMGYISSRSEGIRRAIKEFLEKELRNAELLGIDADPEGRGNKYLK